MPRPACWPWWLGFQHRLPWPPPGGTRCCGYLALPEGDAGPVPGVLLLHEWWGHDDYVRSRAEQVADLLFDMALVVEGEAPRNPGSFAKSLAQVLDGALKA